MGCDIHWHIERRGADDRWHMCASKRSVMVKFYDVDKEKISFAEQYARPEFAIGDRNYDLFAALSGVRGATGIDGQIAYSEWPTDLSEGGRDEETWIEHTPCWIPGNAFLDENSRLRKDRVAEPWAIKVVSVLKRGIADNILGQLINHPEYGLGPANYYQRETGHEAAQRIRQAGKLLPWTEPDSWRVLLFYDS